MVPAVSRKLLNQKAAKARKAAFSLSCKRTLVQMDLSPSEISYIVLMFHSGFAPVRDDIIAPTQAKVWPESREGTYYDAI